ncbi:transporter [Spirosoma sp. HMF3257]|uniref:Transporter n=1 Tax=Spirosoma telluris TaxID=2183553 RepID=A0A327NYS0_9BACT|nr:transporter [Spirosoma telluris]RAI78018.1 transporter [Spirosoma telluris]
MTPFISIVSYALLPALALTSSSVWATYYKLSQKAKSAILHFAAGVIFSVVAVEILPQVVELHNWVLTSLGFGGGILLMLLIRHLTESNAPSTPPKTTTSLPVTFLVLLGIDVLVDGLLLGVGFAAGAKEGKLLAYALGIESISLGLAAATTLGNAGLTRGRSISLLVGIALVFIISAVGGATLLHSLPPSGLDLVLSFGLAALLFLVTEELLQEAHLSDEPAWLTATFYMGFLLFLLLGMLI